MSYLEAIAHVRRTKRTVTVNMECAASADWTKRGWGSRMCVGCTIDVFWNAQLGRVCSWVLGPDGKQCGGVGLL